MKRPRCRQEDSDVGILTRFTLASQKRALEMPYETPGALPTREFSHLMELQLL
jgi:hypothetical protein